MTLARGARLGPYEVDDAIGAGGMGEVYRARDTRLDRTVAVKVLPERVARDEIRKARFEREARAIAQLTHPHICALHDVGEDAGVSYLVMEHLEGETLADRLARSASPSSATGRAPLSTGVGTGGRGLRLEQSLEYAVQIAEALDCAHRRGIVHRDLKPANIFLTRTGVKLLDFGLAQIADSAPEVRQAEHTSAPTRVELTQADGVMGTLPYMSPEQVDGRSGDARSDVFAFGAILYEMVTGQRPFAARSRASLIAAILEHDPPPVTALAPRAPATLARVVRQCLAKDPEERWQSAADLRRELIWIAQELTSPTAPAPPQRSRRAVVWLGAVAAGAALAAGGVYAGAKLAPARAVAPAPEGLHLSISAENAADAFRMSLSPDGTRVIYAAAAGANTRLQLWMRPLAASNAYQLPATDDPRVPIWSPDGRSIAYFGGGKLRILDLDSGTQRVVCDAPWWIAGADWGADGNIVFAWYGEKLLRVPAAGGNPVAALPPGTAKNPVRPRLLPGGRILYFDLGATQPGIYVFDGEGRPPRLLLKARSKAVVAAGHIFFVRDGALLARPFDVARAEVTGDELIVADEVAHDAYSGTAAFDVSANGRIVYRAPAYGAEQFTWFDRAGRKLGTIGEPARHSNFDLAADGSKVAVSIIERRTNLAGIWILDARGRASLVAATETETLEDPVWSPDGTRIVHTRRGGAIAAVVRTAEGGKETTLLDQRHGGPIVEDWSRDGSFVLMSLPATDRGGNRLAVVPVNGPPEPRFVNVEEREVDEAHFSPDGRWIAYGAIQQGRWEVFVTPAEGGRKWIVSAGGGVQPRWRRDGKELFYIALDGTLMAVDVAVAGGELKAGLPKPLFATGVEPHPQYDQYAVAGDGQRFLVNVPVLRPRPPIHVLLGWPGGFDRRAASR